MATKTVKEIVQEVGGKTTIEYSDDSTTSFNIANTVTSSVNPLTGGLDFLAGGLAVNVDTPAYTWAGKRNKPATNDTRKVCWRQGL